MPQSSNIRGRAAVICGGTSSEREISLRSGTAISEGLSTAGWDVLFFDIPEREVVTRCLELGTFDVVFVGFHGGAGEDGRVQAVLEIAGIPFTGCNHASSAIAMDKIFSKRIMDCAGIPTAKWLPWENPKSPSPKEIASSVPFGFPIVVKPACEGSTIGISIASNEPELAEAINIARRYGKRMLFEEYIPGREVTTGILENYRLPIVEVIPESGFYDYEHKYTKGASNYICPAEIDDALSGKIISTGERVFNLFGMRHYARIDFRLNGEKFYCLEANSLPGMTNLSLVPMAAKAVGLEFPELVNKIAMMALEKSSHR
jgi:D-alanine-D-alanine ligase